jgi:hypothetical protein
MRQFYYLANAAQTEYLNAAMLLGIRFFCGEWLERLAKRQKSDIIADLAKGIDFLGL